MDDILSSGQGEDLEQVFLEITEEAYDQAKVGERFRMNPLVLMTTLMMSGCHWGFKPHPMKEDTAPVHQIVVGKQVNPGKRRSAWFNQKRRRNTIPDSNCGRRYQDGALNDTVSHLTRGIAEGEPLHSKSIHLAGREAMVHAWQGILTAFNLRRRNGSKTQPMRL